MTVLDRSRWGQKAPIVIPRGRHLGAARSNRQQIGVAEALRVIENGDDAAVGAHDCRVLQIRTAKLRKRRMPLQHKLDRFLALGGITHLRGVGGYR